MNAAGLERLAIAAFGVKDNDDDCSRNFGGGGCNTSSSSSSMRKVSRSSFHAIRKCSGLEAPVIFLNWDDCSLYLDPSNNDSDVVEYSKFDTMEAAMVYVCRDHLSSSSSLLPSSSVVTATAAATTAVAAATTAPTVASTTTAAGSRDRTTKRTSTADGGKILLHIIRECDGLKAPAIFFAWQDCSLYLDQSNNFDYRRHVCDSPAVAASVQLPFEAVKRDIAKLLAPGAGAGPNAVASTLKAIDHFFDDEGIADAADLCILSKYDIEGADFDACDALAPLRKRAVRRRFACICQYLAKGGAIHASTTMDEIFRALHSNHPPPILKLKPLEPRSPHVESAAAGQFSPQPNPQRLELRNPSPAANFVGNVGVSSEAATGAANSIGTVERNSEAQQLEPTTPSGAANLVGNVGIRSIASGPLRRGLPYHLCRQLCEDIENNGGISNFIGTKHKLASLLEIKPHLYGKRGEKIRARIQKKVWFWQKLYEAGEYELRVLLKYHVKSASIRSAEAWRRNG